MGSVQRQGLSLVDVDVDDDEDDVDFCLSDGFVEAPTLSSKEMERAREQALKVMKTNSPKDALKIFTEVGGVKPPEFGAGGKATAAVPAAAKN